MFDSYWAMLGGASATISGLAFVSTTIFYNKLYSIARYANKIGLEGNIAHRFIVKAINNFVLLISPLVLASIIFITHVNGILDCWVLYTIKVAGLILLIIGLMNVFNTFFYYDTNIAHFKCSQKYINSITESKKQLKEKINELHSYFKSLEEWLRAFSATLADVDKAIYGTYKDHTETIIYGSNSDALINRYELIVKNINALNTDTEITYKKIIELTDMYEDIVTDVDKAKGQLRNDIRGLAKKDNKYKIFFQNKHPDIFLDKEDDRCK